MKTEEKIRLVQKTILFAAAGVTAAMAQRAKKKKDKADLLHALEIYRQTMGQEEADTEE